MATARGGAALAYARWLLQHRLDAAFADPRVLPPDPEIEAVERDAEEQIASRHGELANDLGSLDDLQQTIEAFEAVCRDTSTADRLNAWIHSWVEPPRWDRVAALVGAALAAVALPALLPLTLALAVPSAAAAATAAALLVGLLGACSLAVSVFVLGDGVRYFGRLQPQPANFAEQRLEVVAAQLALQLGIAPPDVYIVHDDVPNASAFGRPQGPSLVRVHTGLLKAMTSSQAHAVIAHELGHLAGDDIRIGMAARRALAPLIWFGDLAMGAVFHLTILGFWRPRTRLRPASFGWTCSAILALPLLALWFVVVGPLAVIRLVAAELTGLVSQRQEFDADAVAARLLGPEGMSGALEVLLAHQQGEVEETPTVRQILFGAPAEIGPVLRLRLILDAWVGWLSGTHPPLEDRIRALYQPVHAGHFAALGLVRAVAIVLLAVLSSGNLAGAAVERVGRFDPSSLQVAPTAAPSGRSALVWTNLGACTVRSGPGTETDPLGFPPNDACCEIVGERGRWHQVQCDEVEGWMHGSCLRKAEERPCVGRDDGP